MTKIKLPLNIVKEFINVTSGITADKANVLTILAFVRIEIVFGRCYLYYSNYHTFCKYYFDTLEEDCDIIIPRDKLSLICKESNQNELFLTINDKSILIKDGELDWKVSKSLDKPTDFPALVNTDGVSFTKIDKNIIDIISDSKNFSGKDTLIPWFNSVYLGGYEAGEKQLTNGTDVFSCNGSCMSVKTLTQNLPQLSMSIPECELVSKFPYIEYGDTENWNLYKYENTYFGFRNRSDAHGFNYHYIRNLCKFEHLIKIRTEDLLRFCRITKEFSGSVFCNSKFKLIDKDKAQLIWKDESKGEENIVNIQIQTSEITDLEFHFNPILWGEILKGVCYEEILICDEGNVVSLTHETDKSFFGIGAKEQAL